MDRRRTGTAPLMSAEMIVFAWAALSVKPGGGVRAKPVR
jgi:hypothetical protein